VARRATLCHIFLTPAGIMKKWNSKKGNRIPPERSPPETERSDWAVNILSINHRSSSRRTVCGQPQQGMDGVENQPLRWKLGQRSIRRMRHRVPTREIKDSVHQTHQPYPFRIALAVSVSILDSRHCGDAGTITFSFLLRTDKRQPCPKGISA
jgi:hypothetical protein